MPRRWDDEDDWDEDDEPEEWDEEDDETDVLPCPACGAEVYEEAERCPACGAEIVRRLRAWEGRPRWWIVLGLLGIGAVIYLLLPF